MLARDDADRVAAEFEAQASAGRKIVRAASEAQAKRWEVKRVRLGVYVARFGRYVVMSVP